MRSIALLATVLLSIPAVAHAEEERTHVRSVPLLVTGIAVGGVGATAVTIGGVLLVLDAAIKKPVPQIDCPTNSCPSFNSGPSGAAIMGGIFLGAGAGALAAAIPMVIIGARRLPIEVAPSGPNGSSGITLRLTF